MKKFAVLMLALASLGAMTGCDDDDDSVKVPAAVQDTFGRMFPGAGHVEWAGKQGYLVAEFREGGTDMQAWFDAAGKWYMTEEDVPYALLPQAVRKFARMFILKKITLDFRETGRTVLTDGKWLSFVVEQVLSNALKYTPAGGRIRIYGDGETLVIADSGIGIRPEDLPRVFEKGFTGYNGREDKKSTGIGLYLCRRVMDRLNHGISIVSRPGQGTLVRLDLSRGRRVVE